MDIIYTGISSLKKRFELFKRKLLISIHYFQKNRLDIRISYLNFISIKLKFLDTKSCNLFPLLERLLTKMKLYLRILFAYYYNKILEY